MISPQILHEGNPKILRDFDHLNGESVTIKLIDNAQKLCTNQILATQFHLVRLEAVVSSVRSSD